MELYALYCGRSFVDSDQIEWGRHLPLGIQGCFRRDGTKWSDVLVQHVLCVMHPFGSLCFVWNGRSTSPLDECDRIRNSLSTPLILK